MGTIRPWNFEEIPTDSLVWMHEDLKGAYFTTLMTPFYTRIDDWQKKNPRQTIPLEVVYEFMRKVAEIEVEDFSPTYIEERKMFFDLIFLRLGQIRKTQTKPKHMPETLFQQLIHGLREFNQAELQALPKSAWDGRLHATGKIQRSENSFLETEIAAQMEKISYVTSKLVNSLVDQPNQLQLFSDEMNSFPEIDLTLPEEKKL